MRLILYLACGQHSNFIYFPFSLEKYPLLFLSFPTNFLLSHLLHFSFHFIFLLSQDLKLLKVLDHISLFCSTLHNSQGRDLSYSRPLYICVCINQMFEFFSFFLGFVCWWLFWWCCGKTCDLCCRIKVLNSNSFKGQLGKNLPFYLFSIFLCSWDSWYGSIHIKMYAISVYICLFILNFHP